MSQATAPPAIQAVTFDGGGTLIEVWPSVGHVYAEVATRHGIKDLSTGLLDRKFAAAWRAATAFSYSRCASNADRPTRETRRKQRRGLTMMEKISQHN